MKSQKKEETLRDEIRSEALTDEQLEAVAGGGPHVRVFDVRTLP